MQTIKTDIAEFNILNIKVINSEMKTIYVEEKPKGMVILISDKVLDNIKDIKLFEGFGINFTEDSTYIELIGLDIKLELEVLTRLNIDKKLMYIEEVVANKYRLTFSRTFIQDVYNVDKILIKWRGNRMKVLEKVLRLILNLTLHVTLIGMAFVGISIYGEDTPFSKVWACILIFMAFVSELWYLLEYVQGYNYKREIQEIRRRK